jgi:hypothetical protein
MPALIACSISFSDTGASRRFVNFFTTLESGLPRGDRQPHDPTEHGPKQPPRQMTLRQEQPIIAGMFHQPTARLLDRVKQLRAEMRAKRKPH